MIKSTCLFFESLTNRFKIAHCFKAHVLQQQDNLILFSGRDITGNADPAPTIAPLPNVA
jgi:hypothetical protein